MERNVNPIQFIYPNTKEVSYILGFLWADGYLNPSGYTISTEIISEDAIYLIPIFTKTGKWSITYRKRKHWKPQTKICSFGKDLYSFLLAMDYGTKTIPTKILNLIPKNLHHYWWRGYFDGDGCFYYYKPQYLRQLSITSDYNQDWSFVENLSKTLGIKKYQIKQTVSKKGHKSSQFRITNKSDITKFGTYIYKNYDELGFKRKYETYLLI